MRVHNQLTTARHEELRSTAAGGLAGEQDTRWLCRELHDGLGPALAGLVLGLGTAQAVPAGDPDLRQLLGRLAGDAQRAVADLRRIVSGLRPSALKGATREQIRGAIHAGLGHQSRTRQDTRPATGPILPARTVTPAP